MDRMLNGYYRAIRRNLVAGSRQEKDEFLAGFVRDVESFVKENPASSIQDIKSRFGKPEEIAQDFISALDKEVFQESTRRKKRFRLLSVVILIVLFLVISSFCIVDYIKNEAYRNGAFVEYITTDNPAHSEYSRPDKSNARHY